MIQTNKSIDFLQRITNTKETGVTGIVISYRHRHLHTSKLLTRMHRLTYRACRLATQTMKQAIHSTDPLRSSIHPLGQSVPLRLSNITVAFTMLPRIICLCALLAVSVATDVKQCKGQSIPDLAENVHLIPCKKPPCKLHKGTEQHITIKFKPATDLKEVTNNVKAEIGLGVPVPFIGVDGNSICDKIENEAGEKASCPLKAGETYVYKDSFPVLSIYPSIQVRVHWALRTEEKDIICFEVPAKIV